MNMKKTETDLLTTNFSRLAISFAGVVLAREDFRDEDVPDAVALGIRMAEEMTNQLMDREALRVQAAAEERARQPKEDITWVPDLASGDTDRKGYTWTPEEVQALGSGFRNGDNSAILSSRHLRTPTAILAQLATRGHLHSDGDGRGNYTRRDTGEVFL